MAYIDDKNRAPKVERLPDLRERVTRQYDVINFVGKTPAQILADVWLPWGTADKSYANCLLIKQDVGGQLDQPFETPTKNPPQLTRVYEQISPTGETMVGNGGQQNAEDDGPGLAELGGKQEGQQCDQETFHFSIPVMLPTLFRIVVTP